MLLARLRAVWPTNFGTGVVPGGPARPLIVQGRILVIAEGKDGGAEVDVRAAMSAVDVRLVDLLVVVATAQGCDATAPLAAHFVVVRERDRPL
jgi:hypothetical protein